VKFHHGRPSLHVDDQNAGSASSTDDGGGVAAARDESEDDERYRLISIVAARAPEGCTGSDWHVYRIAQGENGITGYRRGDLARVTVEVETIVTALNGRRRWAKDKAASKSQRRAAAAARRAAAAE
jgi:hypothetical protein